MTIEKLNSELPLGQLMELSASLNKDKYKRAYGAIKARSMLLNPVAPKGTGASSMGMVFDSNGLKRLFKEYADMIIQNENRFRALWAEHERFLKMDGKPMDGLPGGRQAAEIYELAARLKVIKEEAKKLEKCIEDCTVKEAIQLKQHRTRLGSCKRDGNGKINQVDQMKVDDNGIITELGQNVNEYLEQIKAEKERKRSARNAAQAAQEL